MIRLASKNDDDALRELRPEPGPSAVGERPGSAVERQHRVLVAGWRKYSDPTRVWKLLDDLNASIPVNIVFHGGAPGVDAMARAWAERRGVACAGMPAQFDYYGKAGGPVRNGWMLKYLFPTRVLAFYGPNITAATRKSGTADVVRQALAARVEVREYFWEDTP